MGRQTRNEHQRLAGRKTPERIVLARAARGTGGGFGHPDLICRRPYFAGKRNRRANFRRNLWARAALGV
jgi:hypothetical protein